MCLTSNPPKLSSPSGFFFFFLIFVALQLMCCHFFNPRGLFPDFISAAGLKALLSLECELCQAGTGLSLLMREISRVPHLSGVWTKRCRREDEGSPAQGGFLPALQDVTVATGCSGMAPIIQPSSAESPANPGRLNHPQLSVTGLDMSPPLITEFR